MLKYIAYLSSQSHTLSDEGLTSLLNYSRKNNLKSNITGMLVHVSSNFVQFLEGPEQNINKLYEKILKDPRHNDVMLIAEGTSDKRHFGSWSMAFKNLKDTDLSSLDGFRPYEPGLLFNYPTSGNEELLPALRLLQNFLRDMKD